MSSSISCPPPHPPCSHSHSSRAHTAGPCSAHSAANSRLVCVSLMLPSFPPTHAHTHTPLALRLSPCSETASLKELFDWPAYFWRGPVWVGPIYIRLSITAVRIQSKCVFFLVFFGLTSWELWDVCLNWWRYISSELSEYFLSGSVYLFYWMCRVARKQTYCLWAIYNAPYCSNSESWFICGHGDITHALHTVPILCDVTDRSKQFGYSVYDQVQ